VQIIRYTNATGMTTVGLLSDDQIIANIPPQPGGTSSASLPDLLHLSSSALRAYIEQIVRLRSYTSENPEYTVKHILAPIDRDTEVWAAGVTYKRSEKTHREESIAPDIYSRVYTAQRPELFFKANPRRVAGPEDPVVIRIDSTRDVPEPELVIVLNTYGEIVGYTIGNDISSRSIEGENPLYLPQAKVYQGSCALGSGITPAWEIENPYNLTIAMTIERDGQKCWKGKASTKQLNRKLPDLAAYLFREDVFPDGVLLCTGTALVPDPPFTLQEGDIIEISIDQLGTLRNHVVRGKEGFTYSATRV
jgi:2-dehydro-3-deoxy-D-arabinonate dehydratase